MAVTLGKSTLVDKIAELTAIDEKITAARGDEKVLKAQAHHDLLVDGDVTFDATEAHELDGMCYNEITAYVDSMKTLIADAESWLDQQVAEKVKASRDANKDDVEALVTLRTSTAATAEALRTILADAGIADLPEVPKGRKAGSSAGTSTRTVKVSGARYYRVTGGEKTYQPDSQNTLSSLVYYQSHHFSPDGKRMTTDDFVALCRSAGIDPKAATPWQAEENGVIVGMDVIPTE